MKNLLRMLSIIMISVLMLSTTGCLWSTCQIADTVGRNNLSYSVYGAYSGYLSETDKELADSLGNNEMVLWGGNLNYGILEELDLQMGVMGSNFGAGLKYSPQFSDRFRVGFMGGLYTNASNLLITPSLGLIGSYHINENVIFTGGTDLFIRNKNDYDGDVYFSIDLSRNQFFKENVLNNIANVFVPKALQFNVCYPFRQPYDKLHLGISLRYELDFSGDKPETTKI